MLRIPRTKKIPMIASAKSAGGSTAETDFPAVNPPSSIGFISAGKSGSVAAAPTIAIRATTNTPAYGRT
jgi:hypothetical protein